MKPIFSVLSPNVEQDDIRLAQNVLENIFDYHRKNYAQQLAEAVGQYLSADYVIPFQNGRSALWAIIRSYQWPAGSQIILPGFTCAAAVNPVIWSGLEPVFIDVDHNLNIDLNKVEQKISKKTRAILIQHTFGLPVAMDRVKDLAQRHNLVVIEDCAHSLGAYFQNRPVGGWGEASFFSFGRDKIISSVFGGVAATNNKKLGSEIKQAEQEGRQPSQGWVKQQLRHPLLVARWVQPYYLRGELGRRLLLILQKTRILSKAMTRREKRGELTAMAPMKMPNELAVLALNQFAKLDRYNNHRQTIADFYRSKLKTLPVSMTDDKIGRVYLKFPIILPDQKSADGLLRYLRRQKIYLYDGWKDTPIVPSDVDLAAMRYHWGSCPRAEDLSGRIVNLPTHINVSQEDAARVVQEIENFFTSL